jgi:ribosomal protein S18 acetylase RimI-like enzyme
MFNPNLRNVTIDDIDLLREVSIETFSSAFAHMNTAANMSFYLNQAFNPEQLKKELQDNDSTFQFLYDREQLVGYMKVNFGVAQTEAIHPDAIEIQRIYLRPHAQGYGLGRYMIQSAEAIGKSKNCPLIWLGVWDQNHRSIGFYGKMGYSIFDNHDFPFGDEMQTDHLMKKYLSDISEFSD